MCAGADLKSCPVKVGSAQFNSFCDVLPRAHSTSQGGGRGCSGAASRGNRDDSNRDRLGKPKGSIMPALAPRKEFHDARAPQPLLAKMALKLNPSQMQPKRVVACDGRRFVADRVEDGLEMAKQGPAAKLECGHAMTRLSF